MKLLIAAFVFVTVSLHKSVEPATIKNDHEGKLSETVNYPLAGVRNLIDSAAKSAPNGCSCMKNACSCCANIYVPFIINEKVCVIISYISADLGLRLKITFNGRVVYETEVSVKNPPPLCFGIPYLSKYASLCLDLYNISWREHIGGCMKIEIKVFHFIDKSFDIGCFHFNDLEEESKAAVSRILFDLHQLKR